jgi:hypothetical protein
MDMGVSSYWMLTAASGSRMRYWVASLPWLEGTRTAPPFVVEIVTFVVATLTSQ